LPKRDKFHFIIEKFEQFLDKTNQLPVYTPLITLSFLSVLLTLLLDDWLNFFLLYTALIFVYIFLLSRQNFENSWIVTVLAIVYRFLPLFSASILLSTDIVQYGSFGTKILGGLLPYRDFDAPYPPLSLYVTVPFVMLGDLRLLKAFFSVCDIFIVFVVCKMFLREAENVNRIFMWLLLFPVSLIEYSISGHNDSLAILLLIISLVLLERSVIASSVLMALSILCKIFPIILVPLVLRQLYSNSKKSAIIFLSVLIATFCLVSLPFVLISWDGYFSMIIGITRYSVPYGLLTSLLNFFVDFSKSIMFFHLLAVVLLMEFSALAFYISFRYKWSLVKSYSVCLLILPILLPQFHPWYLLWAFPFIAIHFSSNLKLIKIYMVFFLFVHISYYLTFSFFQS